MARCMLCRTNEAAEGHDQCRKCAAELASRLSRTVVGSCRNSLLYVTPYTGPQQPCPMQDCTDQAAGHRLDKRVAYICPNCEEAHVTPTRPPAHFCTAPPPPTLATQHAQRQRWKENPMQYLLDIADERLEAAAHALAAADIYFDPTASMAIVNPEADLDHACSAKDAPAVLEALNGILEYTGSPRRLDSNAEGLDRPQTRSLLSIAAELICWSGNRPADDSRIAEHGGVEAVIAKYHPELARLYTPPRATP